MNDDLLRESPAPPLRPIRIAAQLHPQHGDYPAIRDAARRAEELDYDIVYTWDHFFPLYGDQAGGHLECWTMLGALAEATRRVEIGPLVSCTSYRNPHLIADMARTLDRISGGRAILGLGAGWRRRDYEEYGFEYGTFGQLLDRFELALEAIEARLPLLNPLPYRRMPVLIGGSGERRTLRLVAEHADGWHAGFPDRPGELEPKVAALLRWCDVVGRDPTTIEWGVGVEPEDVDRFVSQDADTYLAMGFRQFTLGFNGPTWPVDAGSDFLAWRDDRNTATGAAREAIPAP
ncbi:MAG: LLM class F420-dependent oxidoreductase [Chloroflexota bacterium]